MGTMIVKEEMKDETLDTEVFGSDAPESCLNGAPVMIGIDEAGRGPVLGPMVYGAAYWPVKDDEEMSALGFDDSKALAEKAREELFEKIKNHGNLGWMVRVISASEISDQMQRQTSNLNEISRNAAIQLINTIRSKGVNVKKVLVDTVGDPRWYQSFLTKHFNNTIEFRVEKKADSLFKVVSAASIAAKVTRDSAISQWEWETPSLQLSKEFGSGYPSDPRTKTWLSDNCDHVFAFPNIVRFSWGTIDSFLDSCAKVEWPHDKENAKSNDPATKGTPSITSFLQVKPNSVTSGSSKKKNKRRRVEFFTQRKMEHVVEF